MSEYPEALIEKVAQAAYDRAFLKHAPEYVDRWVDLVVDNEPSAESWREVARAALDALGLREELSAFPERFATHRRYVTDWEAVND